MNKASKNKKQKSQKHTLSNYQLRLQLVTGYMILILFLIATSTLSYHLASSGLIANYEASAKSSIEMASQYLNSGLSFSVLQAEDIVADTDVSNYTYGTYTNDSTKQSMLKANILTKLSRIAAKNPFIGALYLIPSEGTETIQTSESSSVDGFYNELSASFSSEAGWGSTHEVLDQMFQHNSSDYACYYHIPTNNKKGTLIVDIDYTLIQETLNGLNFGNNSIVSLVFNDGRELTSNDTQNFSFLQQDFYQEMTDQSVCTYVTRNDTTYLYIKSECVLADASFCLLVPKSSVMSSAMKIKNITLICVILSILISLILASFVTLNLSRSIRFISQKLHLVSEGDLTVTLNNSSHNEFGPINHMLANTIQNTHSVIEEAHEIDCVVASSTEVLLENAEKMQTFSNQISCAIEEISEGVSQQANDAEHCLQKMDLLSTKILDVTVQLNHLKTITIKTQDLVKNGFHSLHQVKAESESTTQITEDVMENITALEKNYSLIEYFIDSINEIASRTNLLSLNASIEASHAGESGRGFAVVAKEISNLASTSLNAASQIQNSVNEIREHTRSTITAATKAEDIVKTQEASVLQTISDFEIMKTVLEDLINGIQQIGEDVGSMDKERCDTLTAIESISAVSEETAASSCVVSDSAREQLDHVSELNKNCQALQDKADGLHKTISKFKI